MITVKEILTDKISPDIEYIDRVYLSGYVQHLQMAGGLVTFICEQLGYPIPSPMLLSPINQAFRKRELTQLLGHLYSSLKGVHNATKTPAVSGRIP